MASYVCEVHWSRGDQDFLDHQYSRGHRLRFDAGIDVPGSSSPHIVPVPLSDASAVDPEELFVASLSSCHMLLFLSIAAKRRFIVDRYTDAAQGTLGKDMHGKTAMTSVTLRPQVDFCGSRLPGREEVARMHHLAHDACFIANSVSIEVQCEPVYATDA